MPSALITLGVTHDSTLTSTPMRLSNARYIVLLATASFLIRLAAVLAMRDITQGPIGAASGDDVQFQGLGQRLADGTGYRNAEGKLTSFRAPGYPFLLAAVYRTIGDYPSVVYVLNCLLGAFACVLAYLLAREFFRDDLARLTGVLASLCLGHIYFATNYLSENLFVPCLCLAVWLMVRYVKGGPIWLVGLAGVLMGYATLTRPMAILLLLLLPVVLAIYEFRTQRWPFVSSFIFVTTFMSVVLPWTYRNYAVHGHFVLVATNGGSTFYGSNNDRSVDLNRPRDLGYWFSTTELPYRQLIDEQPNEWAHDQMEWKLGKDWLREHPLKIPQLLLFKSLRLWWIPDFDAGRFYYVLRVAAYAPYFLLMLFGAVRVFQSRDFWTPPWLVVHAAILATILTALIFFGEPRFRDANAPLLMLYATLGVNQLAGWISKKPKMVVATLVDTSV